MRKRLRLVLLSLLMLASLAMVGQVYASVLGDAKFTIYDVTTSTTKCSVIVGGPANCSGVVLTNGHFYTLTVEDATGAAGHRGLIRAAHSNTKWAGRGYYANYIGGTAPTCTYTDTAAAWSADCQAPTAIVTQVVMYGYASSVTDDSGSATWIKTPPPPNVGTTVTFNYSTP